MQAVDAGAGGYTKEDAKRDENCRIFRALRGLRAAGANPSTPAAAGTTAPRRARTWGTLCAAYDEDHRLHAALRPFLHTRHASRDALFAALRSVLALQGVVPTSHPDVFSVEGAVEGDGTVRSVQVFPNSQHGLDEYLMLS
jgi:hypothetical protein